jgi:osmotically inducible protein OsmC
VERAGYRPESIRTRAGVKLEKRESGFEITGIELNAEAAVPGIAPEELGEIARSSKENCPVGKALAAIPITVNARPTG